jgi:hypothetical protein
MTTESQTPRVDALVANPRESINTSVRLHHAVSLARTLESEAAMLKDGLLARMSLISSQEEIIARLREALTQIANSGDAYNDLRATARAALEVQS